MTAPVSFRSGREKRDSEIPPRHRDVPGLPVSRAGIDRPVHAVINDPFPGNHIRIVVDDRGPGIPDVNIAMQEGFSTATSEMREVGFGAGMGLPNIKSNADKFSIESVVGKGTRLDIIVNIN